MLHPSYKEMIRKINNTATEEDMQITSRYSLVIAAAKRARQINSGSEPLVEAKAKEKNLSVAVDEFFSGKVHILEEEEDSVLEETEEILDAEDDETDVFVSDYVDEAAYEQEEDTDPEEDETDVFVSDYIDEAAYEQEEDTDPEED